MDEEVKEDKDDQDLMESAPKHDDANVNAAKKEKESAKDKEVPGNN